MTRIDLSADVENSRGRIRDLLRQQAAIADFGSFALRHHDLALVLAEAARACAEGIGAPFAKVCRYRADENDLLVEAGHGWHEGVVGNVVSRADESSPQGRAFATGKPSICHDLKLETGFVLPKFYAEHGIVSTVDVIIIIQGGGRPYGVLEIDNNVQQSYDPHVIDFLTAFANVLGEAVATSARVEGLRTAVQSMTVAGEALGKSEQRFRTLIETAPNAIVAITTAGLIEMVNTEAERIFGYSRKELLHHKVDMLVPARFRDRRSAALTHFEAPTPSSTESGIDLYGLCKDGREFRAEIGWNLIETAEGPMAVSTIVDLTLRTQLEAQLRQAQKMEAVGQLTAGVAHDFNNLLQAVMSGMEALLMELDEQSPGEFGEIRAFAEIALHAAMHGGQLTQRLLAFSRQQVLSPRSVPLRKMFVDLAGLISRPFGPNIELIISPIDSDLAVLADGAQLEAAVLNLAVNARDAMVGGGRLTISAYTAEPVVTMRLAPGAYVVIAVVDNGVGMDAATVARACDPFFTTKGLKGSGLGLSMVQGFVRQSGGELVIESLAGSDTRIELWLPQGALTEPPAKPKSPREALAGRILLVDDAADVLATVGVLLQQAGFVVTRTVDAHTALAQLRSGARFELIISDFALPGQDGAALLEAARRIDRTLPQLMISGYLAHDPGGPDATLVLRKPFSNADLIARVHALMIRPREE